MKTFALSIALLMIASFAIAQEPAATKSVVVKEQASVANTATVQEQEKKDSVVEPAPQSGTVAPAAGNGCCNPDPCCKRRVLRRVWSRLGSRRCCR